MVVVVKVVVNLCIGLVVMNQKVMFEVCVVVYGSFLVVVDGGQFDFGQGVDIQVKQVNGSLMNVKVGVNLVDVVKVLNLFGVNLFDLFVILQVMKVFGVLCVEFEII